MVWDLPVNPAANVYLPVIAAVCVLDIFAAEKASTAGNACYYHV